MKYFLSTLFLISSQVAFAQSNLNCLSDNGASLSILHAKSQLGQSLVEANAVLNLNGANELYHGTYSPVLNLYNLKDQNGTLVSLKVSKPFRHGGRCGRCSPDPLPPIEQEIFAKLTLSQIELDFTCTKIK